MPQVHTDMPDILHPPTKHGKLKTRHWIIIFGYLWETIKSLSFRIGIFPTNFTIKLWGVYHFDSLFERTSFWANPFAMLLQAVWEIKPASLSRWSKQAETWEHVAYKKVRYKGNKQKKLYTPPKRTAFAPENRASICSLHGETLLLLTGMCLRGCIQISATPDPVGLQYLSREYIHHLRVWKKQVSNKIIIPAFCKGPLTRKTRWNQTRNQMRGGDGTQRDNAGCAPWPLPLKLKPAASLTAENDEKI